MSDHILRIDASATISKSVTRSLSDKIIAQLSPENVVTRDLALNALPQIDTAWISARGLPPDAQNTDDRDTLALSDVLIAEIRAADTLVIGVPIYNFSIPAALKAWIDLIARAGETFRYTETGPEGLLTGKRAILAVASGGVPVGSEMDFATGYLRFVLGFIGITDVQIVAADQMATKGDESIAKAGQQIAALAA